jgi:putative SOS response-associated peptidase YedK
MCNDYRLKVDVASIVEDFADLKIKIRFGEGAPNLEAREDIKITDVAPIIRTVEGVCGEGDMVQRRWPEQATGLQFPLGGPRVHLEPLPDHCGRLLRVHRSGREGEEAEGQVAHHQAWRADLLHCRHLA